MESKNSPREDNKCEADVNDLIPRFSDIGRDGSFNDAIIVIFDLDLTDLSRNKEICQIAAQCNGNNFNQYIIPNRKIARNCTAYHGLKIKRVQNQRILFHYENEVTGVSPREGLENFLEYLSNQTGRVLLAAHNCFKFDCWTIIRQMRNYDLFDRLESLVLGFIDTLPIFKSLLPERIQQNLNFKLPSLATDYLDENQIPENRHAAISVEILAALITRIGCTNEIMIQQARNLASFMKKIPEEVEERITDLQPLNVDVSDSMIAKIAKAGISMDMLQSVYVVNGDAGVEMLLREDIEGNPRVTNSQRIIQSIIARLAVLVLADNEDAVI